jgi:hypothetical protein
MSLSLIRIIHREYLTILRAQFWGGSYILSAYLLRCQTPEIHMK